MRLVDQIVKKKESMKKRKLLILDDDQILGRTIAQMANACGWDATSVLFPQDAIEFLENNEYDCFITDYRMPEQTGLEVIKGLRTLNNQTPVILMSGSLVSLDQHTKANLSIQDFLQKPFGYQELQRALEKLPEVRLAMAA